MKMGIEHKGGVGKGKIRNETKKGKQRKQQQNKKKSSSSSSSSSSSQLVVHRLYEICKDVFADCGPSIVPSPDKLTKLSSVLDGMTYADVGLKPNMPIFSSELAPTITYMHLHECDKFSIGIFCLPPKSVIPLHNHPGMTVFSKLLFGTMHIKSYDWSDGPDKGIDATTTDVDGPRIHADGSRLAKVKIDSEFTAPCKTSILYPADGGNMHCFTAKTACAVIDVLGPPYCDPDGRHCQYYSEIPFADISVEGLSVPEQETDGYVWLKEREKPKDLTVVGVPYNGPKIMKK